MKLFRIASVAILALAMSTTSDARDLPSQPGAERTVAMYDAFCLAPAPDLDRTASAAKAGNFTEIKGRALKNYAPDVSTQELRAWTYEDFGLKFSLTTSIAKPDGQIIQDMPLLANTTNFSCSLIIPNKQDNAGVLSEMEKLVGRRVDENYTQGPFRVHVWFGQTDQLTAMAYYYEPTRSGVGGLLSTVTFVNK